MRAQIRDIDVYHDMDEFEQITVEELTGYEA